MNAFEALATRMRAQNDVLIDLEVDLAYEQGRSAARHAPELELAIYRLVQEALTNVVKHAEAVRVSVRVADEENDGIVCVEVRDDGRGFDTRVASEGFGLLGMRERVEAIHGSLSVDSTPGGGTKLVARLPIARRGPASDPVAAGVS